MLDKGAPWLIRGSAARLLAISNSSSTVGALLHQFFGQDEKDELWDTALVLETLSDRRAVGPLAGALNDPNPHRRHAAARALGWIPQAGNRAVEALIGALTDQRQLQPVREEAAESLAYLYSRRAIPPLISVLSDSDVRIRFWAVFALGSIRSRRTSRHSDRRVVPALMSMLGDPAIPPGNWWSVAREALAMLGNLDPPEERYRRLLAEELQRVQVDPESSPADRRWAESYR
jgi:HEAT repeat protein